MALFISDECINCAICEAECPNNAIFSGEQHYEIDPERCTVCQGFFPTPQCQEVCPVDCILPMLA
ncbi:YfhL family 4Fe-4S dicluster ferredoxin [Acidithiobacillus sp.]|uniref:YfhL family 4Fe-4S dicluster ferredoxin n=1 Tax=Acidithiobacillus sp. TaxID=1872118 RepID=UPI003CFEB1ED